MLSYGYPICSITNSPANIFCCTDRCTRPAFACSQECLFALGHQNHQTQSQSQIKQQTQHFLDISLTKDEILRLQKQQKQQKQLKIFIEELTQLYEDHFKIITQFKQSLLMKLEAETVLLAIREKATNGITGGHMAQLMKDIADNQMFINEGVVSAAIEERNLVVDVLQPKLRRVIDQYKKDIAGLFQPHSIPKIDKITPTIDITMNNRISTLQTGVTVQPDETQDIYHPIFASQSLAKGQSFNVRIVNTTKCKNFYIGVTTADLINKANQQGNQNFVVQRTVSFIRTKHHFGNLIQTQEIKQQYGGVQKGLNGCAKRDAVYSASPKKRHKQIIFSSFMDMQL